MAATEEKKDNPVTEPGPPTDDKKKPNVLLIIVGVLIFLLVVAVGGFIGYTKLPSVIAQYAGHEPESEQRVTRRLEVKDMVPLDPFLINLADTDDIRFLKTTIQLGMAEKLKAGFDKNSKEVALIRDAIISLLSSKTSDQIILPEGKENLREEIRTLINSRAIEVKVAEVYFTEFLVQL
jgi:flagellar FliL protein